MSLVVLASCQEPNAELPQASISVRVADATSARTITPEGNVNISHYVISVHNDAENIHQESGYLTKGSMFTVSNVPAGTWYAKVDAYINRGENVYVKVASDQSEPKAVAAGSSTVFDLVLDTLDEVMSGDVTVTLKMPTTLATQDTPFWYTYTITGMTDEEFSKASELLSGTTGADGLATITIDSDSIGLMQGAYRFEITVQDKETEPTLTRQGVEAMRLINGLTATGMVDLSNINEELFQFDLTITDKVGNILTPSLKDGQEVYQIGWEEDVATLTVTLEEPIAESETINWYVNGVLDESVNTDNASDGQYTFTFQKPDSAEYLTSYVVTAIIRDNNTLMSIGSLSPFTVGIANPEPEFAEQIFTFELNNDRQSYRVTGLAQEMGEFIMPENGVLEIPSTYQGKPVTGIIDDAFRDRIDIIGSVKIPDNVTYIGYNTFNGCSALTSINIPEGVTELANGSFANCINLSEITLPSTLEELGIGSTHDGVFENCSALTYITIPDSVTSIANDAFSGCSALESINIPDGVTEISYRAFRGCSSLETVEIADASQLTSIERSTFEGCSALKEINIPVGVTAIGYNAFKGCSSLTNISIPEGIEILEYGTFADCSSLVKVTLPSTLKNIKGSTTSSSKGVFEDCLTLTDITIPDGVTEIGAHAFEGCSALTEINIPAGVAEIGYSSFERCTTLENVSLPGGVTKIGNYAFSGCSVLTEISIPDSVTEIGTYAFEGCSALKEINIPDGVIRIMDGTFLDCTALGDVTIPEGVIEIRGRAFENCTSLSEIILPSTLEILHGDIYGFDGYRQERGAFYDCSSLTSIAIPDNVTKIGDAVFGHCHSLKNILIPNSVTSTGMNVFTNSHSLTDIYCEANSIPEGWNKLWKNNTGADVYWGASRSEYNAIMNNENVPYEVPQPIIFVDAGNATITCDKSFAHIYYTTNGTEPVNTDTLYTAPFEVQEGITVKAVAYVGNDIYSTVAEYIVE